MSRSAKGPAPTTAAAAAAAEPPPTLSPPPLPAPRLRRLRKSALQQGRCRGSWQGAALAGPVDSCGSRASPATLTRWSPWGSQLVIAVPPPSQKCLQVGPKYLKVEMRPVPRNRRYRRGNSTVGSGSAPNAIHCRGAPKAAQFCLHNPGAAVPVQGFLGSTGAQQQPRREQGRPERTEANKGICELRLHLPTLPDLPTLPGGRSLGARRRHRSGRCFPPPAQHGCPARRRLHC